MTKCNTDAMRFTRQGRRRVEADFAGGRLISDGGLLAIREVDQRTRFTATLADCLGDPRQPAKIQHEQSTMLAQQIHAIAAGYEDANDHQTLREDPMLQLCAGVEPLPGKMLASPSTLSRLTNRITRRDCVAMHAVLVDRFIASHDEPPSELILDFDATDDPTHGNQEGRLSFKRSPSANTSKGFLFVVTRLVSLNVRFNKIVSKISRRPALSKTPVQTFVWVAEAGCRSRLPRWK